MTKRSAQISVIIPCFNRAETIGFTIENMLRQTLPPDEVIVVDDGSTDHSADAITAFGDPVRLIRQENEGPGAARNAGFAASSGDFIQFMDSDDFASLNKLEVHLDALVNSDASFTYSPWVRVSVAAGQLSFEGPVLQARALPAGRTMLHWQLGAWCTVFQCCLFRRDALEAAGPWRTDLRCGEDGEYLVRILRGGARPVFVGGNILFYRVGAGEQLTGGGEACAKQAADLTKYYELVGDHVKDEWRTLSIDARLSAVLQAWRHSRHCRRHGWPGIDPSNSWMKTVQHTPEYVLHAMDWRDRIVRRLKRLTSETPLCPALQPGPVTEKVREMAAELSLEAHGEKFHRAPA